MHRPPAIAAIPWTGTATSNTSETRRRSLCISALYCAFPPVPPSVIRRAARRPAAPRATRRAPPAACRPGAPAPGRRAGRARSRRGPSGPPSAPGCGVTVATRLRHAEARFLGQAEGGHHQAGRERSRRKARRAARAAPAPSAATLPECEPPRTTLGAPITIAMPAVARRARRLRRASGIRRSPRPRRRACSTCAGSVSSWLASGMPPLARVLDEVAPVRDRVALLSSRARRRSTSEPFLGPAFLAAVVDRAPGRGSPTGAGPGVWSITEIRPSSGWPRNGSNRSIRFGAGSSARTCSWWSARSRPAFAAASIEAITGLMSLPRMPS